MHICWWREAFLLLLWAVVEQFDDDDDDDITKTIWVFSQEKITSNILIMCFVLMFLPQTGKTHLAYFLIFFIYNPVSSNHHEVWL